MVAKFTDAAGSVAPLPVNQHTHPYAATDHVHTDFGAGWQPLPFINGWDDYVSVYSFVTDPYALGAYRLHNGQCWLKGVVSNPATSIPSTGFSIAQLPDWARPDRHQLFQVCGYRNDDMYAMRVDVNLSGFIIPQYHVFPADVKPWVSLSGIRFFVKG